MEKNLSKQFLKVLETSSRLTDQEIEIMLGVPEEKVHMEIAELEKAHIICGYHTLVDWSKISDENVTALVELRVTPQGGDGYEKLASIEEVQNTTTHFTLTKYKESGVSLAVDRPDERMVVTP